MRREALHVLLARVIPALPTEPADVPGDEATRRCDFAGLPPRGPYLISLNPVIVRASTGVTCLETRFLRTAPEYITMSRSHFLRDEIPQSPLRSCHKCIRCFVVNFNRSHVASARYR